MVLKELGLDAGWLLLSTSEMKDLKSSMDGAMKEVDRLNKQTARLVSDKIALSAVLSGIASAIAKVELTARSPTKVTLTGLPEHPADPLPTTLDAGTLIETLGKFFCGEKPSPKKSRSP